MVKMDLNKKVLKLSGFEKKMFKKERKILKGSAFFNVFKHSISDVLGSLDPSLEFCIEAGIKLQNNVLTFLIELRDRTDRYRVKYSSCSYFPHKT